MTHNFIGKNNFLNSSFLYGGHFEKIDLEWAVSNKDILDNHFRSAFVYFFPEEARQQHDDAKEELQDLMNTCGRDR